MRVGYCVTPNQQLASYRLRVSIPAAHLGCSYVIGEPGDVSFFYKDGDPLQASRLSGVVYDVVNDHFDRRDYLRMCELATTITVASESMAETVRKHTGRDSVVIDDPYEVPEREPLVVGSTVLWYGHGANLKSLMPYADLPNLKVCTGEQWSLGLERECIKRAAVILLTGNNPGASTNRITKAIRSGRFVVTPGGIPSWEQFRPFCWIGNAQEGVRWALSNREEACKKISLGQDYTRGRFAPNSIAGRWMEAFGSTSAVATKSKRAG